MVLRSPREVHQRNRTHKRVLCEEGILKKTELEEFIEFAFYNVNLNQDELQKSYREFKEKQLKDKIAKLEKQKANLK
jgi:hypothetical protein